MGYNNKSIKISQHLNLSAEQCEKIIHMKIKILDKLIKEYDSETK